MYLIKIKNRIFSEIPNISDIFTVLDCEHLEYKKIY